MLMGADSIDSSWLTTLLIVVGTALSLWSLRRARIRSKQRQRNSATQLEELQSTSAMRSTADGIMVDLEAFARQMSAQLDTKCARLEALLDAADERLGLLQQVNGTPPQAATETDATEPVSAESVAAEPVVVPTAAAQPKETSGIDMLVDDNAEEVDNATDDPQAGAENVRVSERSAARSATKSQAKHAKDTPVHDTADSDTVNPDERETIYEMFDLGHSPLRIAQALKRPVGEVELILQLRSFT